MDDKASSAERRDGERITVTLDAGLLAALDHVIATKAPGTTRAEALRMAFAHWAAERGYLPAEQAGIRPEDLNASNDD